MILNLILIQIKATDKVYPVVSYALLLGCSTGLTAQLAGFIIELMNKIKPKNQGDVIKEMRRIGASVKSGLSKEISQLGVKIEGVEHKVDLLSENQVGMKEKLDATFEMVGKLSEDMTIVKDNIEFMKNSMKMKVDIEEFATLERRVTLLERKA